MHACSFPLMLVCALTLYIVVGCIWLLSISTKDASMVLSTWLLCWVGCFICVLITYRQWRQLVNVCAGSLAYSVVIILSVLWMATSSAPMLVCNSGGLFDICSYAFIGLYITYPAFSFFQCPSLTCLGGTKHPSV